MNIIFQESLWYILSVNFSSNVKVHTSIVCPPSKVLINFQFTFCSFLHRIVFHFMTHLMLSICISGVYGSITIFYTLKHS